ncbi:MAG: regulatory iron-sulfur-containing complex subunit RicT [Bacteroidota bacterium]
MKTYMGCGSCGTGGCSTGGCGRSGGCATGGCNKLNTFDWLNNMLAPGQTEVDNIYEVRFKNTRKGFYRNVNGLRLYIGDQVVVESDRGYDVGTLSLGGVMAELQMRKKGYQKPLREVPRIYRKANEKDLELLQQVREREQETLIRGREIINELNLEMKLSEVEFQGDNAKAIFYYIADHRVDFRELIKLLARDFRIRVEMKQIGLRHEAGLVGGIGSCGRELCCSTWLTDFRTVSTSAARYQNLSLNPMKISGLCGRLKCCLNFELESYLDALEDFPEIEVLETAKGRAILQKTDIFKRRMWFSYINESTWHPLDVDEVKRVAELNTKGQKPELMVAADIPSGQLKDEMGSPYDSNLDFVDVVGTELPPKEERRNPGGRNRDRKSKHNKNRRRGPRNQGGNQQPSRRKGENKNSSGSNPSQKPGDNDHRGSGNGGSGGQGNQRGNRRGGGRNRNQNRRNRNDQDKS